MPEGQDREGYQVGGGLVAGLSENVADRLARLDPVGPGRRGRASVSADEAPAKKQTRAGAKTRTSSKGKKTMAPRKSSTKASAKIKTAAKKPAASKAKTNGKQAKDSAAQQTRSSSEAVAQQKETAFTEPTPGGSEKTVAQMLGEVVWLMTQSPNHKTFFLSDLEWLAMAPIMMKQFRVFYATDTTAAQQEAGSAGGTTGKQTNQSASRPIGVALWASVSEEVEERLKAGNAKLRPQDWRSGDRLWVVDIIAPFGGHEEMIKDLKSQVFQDKTLKFRAVVDGKPGVREV